jgi:hypothetical protein
VTTKTKKQFGYLYKTKNDDIVLKFGDSGTAEKKILCETGKIVNLLQVIYVLEQKTNRTDDVIKRSSYL